MSKVVYFFKMNGCGPCQHLAPYMDQYIQQYSNVIKTYIIDINERPDIAAQFGVRATPTIIFSCGNQLLGQVDGGDINKISNYYNLSLLKRLYFYHYHNAFY